MKFSVGLLLILLFLKESTAETRQTQSTPKIKVVINKCCRIGDVLNKDGSCDAGIGSSKWAPKVYLPKKSSYYPDIGSLPNFMSTSEEVRPTCKNIEQIKSTDIFIVGNGSLYLNDKHISINKIEDYCVDQSISLVCRHDKESVPDNMAVIELTKCCGPNQIYSLGNATKTPCITINSSSPLYNSPLLDGVFVDLTYKFPDCVSNEFAIAGPFLSGNHYPETGDVKTESGKVFHPSQYCVDHVQGERYEGVKIFTCSEHYAISPTITTSQHQDDARFAIYSIGLLISVLFLFATLAVGFLLISNHHVLHWRCQTNYVICLLIGDLLLAITQLAGNNITGASCVVIAHLMHFFFLATFFWLNTMCFNIWWTFR